MPFLKPITPHIARRVRSGLIAVVSASLVLARAPRAVGADDPVAKDEAPPKEKEKNAPLPKDTTTKRAFLEMAAYSDNDHVAVFTPSLGGAIENVTSGASIRGRYLIDVVSAASVDIVSTASHRWHETRHAASLEAEYKPHDFGVTLSGSVSSEPDYLSYGGALSLTKDFDAKNTTLLLGYGFGHDTAGRSGTPFSVFSRELERSSITAGLTQVISRSTVGGVGLDLILENGDQSKPYRYIPMFSADTATKVPLGASIEWVTKNRLPERPLEQLPLARQRFALSGRLAHRFEGSTLRLSERVYDDSWGLAGSTTDLRWIFDAGRRVSFWPHGRFHVQNAVSFWKRAYVSGAAPGWDLPELRTGDRELGPLYTATGGGGIKLNLGSDVEPQAWSISFQADVMYTAYTDDLYLTSRTGVLGAIVLEGQL